jgi:hypothetical protein
MPAIAPVPAQRDPKLIVDLALTPQKRGFDYRFVTPVGGKITGMRAWCPAGPITALQVLAEDASGAEANSTVWGDTGHLSAPSQEIVLDTDDLLIGITGHYGMANTGALDSITNLVLHTADEAPNDPEKLLGPAGGATAFSFMPDDLPIGADIVGLQWGVVAYAISYVGVICEAPGPPDPALLDLDLRWTDYPGKPFPVQDYSAVPKYEGFGTDVPPISSFTEFNLYRIEIVGWTLNIYDRKGRVHVLTFKQALSAAIAKDTPYLYADEQLNDVTVKLPGAVLGRIEWKDGRRLNSVLPYEQVDESQPTFGHAFSEPAESAFDSAPFYGWDLTALDPRHLQRTDSVSQKIFDYPTDASRAYHKSERGNQKLMPNGVMFVTDKESNGKSLTTAASSESQIQTSWTASVGAKAGFGPFSFKASAAFRGSVSDSLSKGVSSTVSTFTIQDHILFVDLPRVAFDAEFLDDLNELILGSDVQYRNFVINYGTHYAFATIYGARSYIQTSFSKVATIHAITGGVSIESEVGGAFAGVTVGASVSGSVDHSSQLSVETSKQMEDIQTEGGEASTGGHLSVGNSPIPILLDLRPITELLNPVFFSDARIYTDVRYKLEAAVLDFANNAGKYGDFDTTSHLPPVLRFYLQSARWKGAKPPAPSVLAIDLYLFSDNDLAITGFVPGKLFSIYNLWSSSDPGAPKLKFDGSDNALGIEKLSVLESAAASATGFEPLVTWAGQTDGDKNEAMILASDFRTTVQTKVLHVGDWEITILYQLIGGAIEWK